MKKFIASIIVAVLYMTGGAGAQQSDQNVVWIQIEAHPSLRVAQARAQDYEARLEDVNGFSLGGSWYGILLGPYLRADAERVMKVYRADRSIPKDAFIAFTRNLGQQFWPVGANVLNRGAIAVTPTQNAVQQTALSEPTPTLQPADETRAEARRSERRLTAEERKDLQIAMRAAGYYNSAIDGAFGRGTRRSMEDWQIGNGFEATGILTTKQRRTLMDQYNAPLISVGMKRVSDEKAGIVMDLPAGTVSFAKYEPPFVQYNSISDLGARVLLISQLGDQATLYGLYDILQTLEVVPLEGPRERSKDRFTLEGRGNGIVSFTQARLKDGKIKGFMLIWPENDENRRIRVLDEMKASFKWTDEVLDPAAGGNSEQNVDLISGLEVRKPRLARSGFFTDGNGTVITTADAVRGCTRITLDEEYQATVVTSDDALGVAVLRPNQALVPLSVAKFRPSDPRLQSDIAVSGYSYEGVLGAPTLTFGILSDLKGLRGETELTRLALAALPGDAGGPVMDADGGVLGMLLPATTTGKQLPADVSFAADASAIRSLLEAAGVVSEDQLEGDDLTPIDLAQMANGMTVLVSCWE